MNLLNAVVLGALVGWLASLLVRSEARQGVVLHVCTGVIGSLLGYAAAGLYGAIGGAVLLLLLFELARRRHGTGG